MGPYELEEAGLSAYHNNRLDEAPSSPRRARFEGLQG